MRQIIPSAASGPKSASNSSRVSANGRRIGGLTAFASLALLAAAAAAAQDRTPGTAIASPSGEVPAVITMSEAGATLEITVGHSMLLQADEPLGTVIVGDDTIATATLGAGNSIILTGLTAGSTNLIVLTEEDETLISSSVAVVPVAGRLRSTVTVVKGAATREQYECRGNACEPVSRDGASTEMLMAAPAEAMGTTASSTD